MGVRGPQTIGWSAELRCRRGRKSARGPGEGAHRRPPVPVRRWWEARGRDLRAAADV